MADYSSQGTELQWDTTTASEYVTIGQVTSISGPSLTHPTIDVTDLGDTAAQKIARGFVDSGEIEIAISFDPASTGIHDYLLDITKTGGTGNYSICWPNFTANSLAFAVGDVNTAADTIAEVGHPFHTGQPVRLSTAGTLPDPLAADTTYYVIKSGVNDYQLAVSNEFAIAGVQVDLIDGGAGAHATHYGTKGSFAANVVDGTPEGSTGDKLAGSIRFGLTDTVAIVG
jgi:hypothetical protein